MGIWVEIKDQGENVEKCEAENDRDSIRDFFVYFVCEAVFMSLFPTNARASWGAYV